VVEKKARHRQISIYLSADLRAKVDQWVTDRPHVALSHLVREALFEYFAIREDKHVDITNHRPS